MTVHEFTSRAGTTAPDQNPSAASTRALLACGIAAGPLYLVVGFAQAFLRPGYDALHDDLSILANGELGWIQITNLILTGLLTLLCAVGMRRALRGHLGGTWGPLLIGLYGIGLVGAGIFVADPMNGFPPGTPEGRPATGSLHGLLHFVCGGLGFIGLIAACFVLARRFRSTGQRGLAAFSICTGVFFVVAFAGIASGSAEAVVVLGFTAAVIVAWGWLAAVSVTLRRAS